MAKKRKSRYIRIEILIVAAVAVYALWMGYAQQRSYTAQTARLTELEEAHEELVYQLEFAENKLSFVGTDEYIEQEARARLGWLKPGETKYVSVGEAPEGYRSSVAPSLSSSDGSSESG